MKTADFLDDNLSGHHGMSDTDDLLAAHPHGHVGRAEECADPEGAYGQDGQEILEKPGFDDLRCREHPADDYESDDEEGHADEDAGGSYESAPYEDDVEERVA